jgi:PAS domain S-box-containing protein
MAPNTALAFMALGAALALLVRTPLPRWVLKGVQVAGGLVAIVVSLRLCEFVPGVPFGTDRWFFALFPQTLHEARTGQMAYQTATSLWLASVAMLLLTSVRRRPEIGTVAGILSCGVTALGLVFFLGYLYGAPFFSHSATIPMALETSVAFVFLGVGLIATAGPETFPLRLLSGPSVRARLLRVFLPFTALTVCIVTWLMHFASRYENAASAALLSAFLVVAALFPVSVICARIARMAGADLERAEQELRQADRQSRNYAAELHALNVTLEQRVHERTGELAGSRDRLDRLNQELKERNEQLQQLADDLAAAALSEGQAYRALRASEERFRLILDTTYEAFVVMDAEGLIKTWNSQAQKTFGWFAEEVLGRSVAETITPPQYREAHTRGLQRFLATGEGPVLNRRIELSAVHKDGHEFPVELTITPIRQGQNYIFGSFLHDISERKQAEETLRAQNVLLQEMAQSEHQAHEALKKTQAQLVQTEKLAALGQLVAGVAHEINNPLSFVSNNVAVLQRDVAALRDLLILYQEAEALLEKEDSELTLSIRDLKERIDLKYTVANLDGLLSRSRDGLKRIQQIVKDLRDFARLDESDLHEVDVNAGIESTLNIIQGQARKQQVALERDLAPLPGVSCYPAKINQVVLNLVSNAIDACSPGAKVTVGTRSVPGGIEIFVADTGSGIDPAIREKIFDPFFTTKPQGKGTGLGLSISYGIVQAHGGTMKFESTVGQGTRFVVHLPCKPPPVAREEKKGGSR